jgi:hypothetical protein
MVLVRVFYDGTDQPVRITEPAPAKPRQSLLELLATWDDIEDRFPEVDDPPPEPVDPFEGWSEVDVDLNGERAPLSKAEWIALLRDVSHLPRRKTPLPDEAFERESFYDERHRPASTICRWLTGLPRGWCNLSTLVHPLALEPFQSECKSSTGSCGLTFARLIRETKVSTCR